MTHYLRNSQGETIADIETTPHDITAVVCIKEFSDHLLSLSEDDRPAWIDDMEYLQEIRSTWFKSVAHQRESPEDFVADEMKNLCKKWKLSYVTD